MNDLLTREHLRILMEGSGEHLVSLYMPTHRIFNEAEQDQIRLKNLLRTAEEQLRRRAVRTPEIDALLKPAWGLVDDGMFWRNQSDGLAIFLGGQQIHFLRLPLTFRELAVVGNFWHVKPLLPLLTDDGRFYVLALSQNQVRLLEGSKHTVAELALPDAPSSLAESMRFNDLERQLQFHAPTGANSVLFHGHGGGREDEKPYLLEFFHKIDRGVQELLNGQRAPLVLAGVASLLGVYYEANTSRYLMGEEITGNPDRMRPDELHAAAWPIVAPHFAQQHASAAERYHELAAKGLGSTDIREIVANAHHGRIDTLFVTLGQRQWGKYEPLTSRVELYGDQLPGARDLLDLAAVQTYLNSGITYAVTADAMPAAAQIAAVLRY